MLQQLSDFSIKQYSLVFILAGALLILGGFLLRDMPVDVFPELNAPTVVIMAESHGLSADEVESYVTFHIESAINGLPHLRRVRSSSTLGLGIIWAEFDWDMDIYRARQFVSERLSMIRESLPDDVEVAMTPVSSITGEIMLLSLQSAQNDPLELRAYAEFDLRKQLLSVPGIAQVVAIGGQLPEYQVLIDPIKLRMYNLSSADVARAAASAHNNLSAGFIPDVQGLELPIRQSGRVQSIEDIQQTVISARESRIVRIADVAEVKLAATPRRGSAGEAEQGSSAHEAVVLSLQKTPGTNTLQLTERIDQVLANLKLPDGFKLNAHVMRQSDFIERAVNNVLTVLRDAAIFVAIIILLFLLNVRTTVISLTALPVSLGIAVLILYMLGLTINVMTLGGLAVAIGELVDDAIIYVENVFRRLRQHYQNRTDQDQEIDSIAIISSACEEIRSAVLFATIIICIVFVPLLFLDGLEGRFFKPLGIAYIAAIAASLFVAMTLTPALCRYFLHKDVMHEEKESKLVTWLKDKYTTILSFIISKRHTVLALSAALSISSIVLLSTFGSSFLPRFNEGTLTIFINAPPGTSLDESERLSRGVMDNIAAIEGVRHVVRRSGRAENDEHAEPPSASEIEVGILEQHDVQEVRNKIQYILDNIPGINTMIGQPIQHRLSHVLSGTKAAIAVNVFGENIAELRETAQRVSDQLKQTPGVKDVNFREIVVDTLPINYRQKDLQRFGLSAAEAGMQVKRLLAGETVAQINQGSRQYNLVVRLKPALRDSIEDIRNLVLQSKEGTFVKLHEIADIYQDMSPNLLVHENGRRKIVIPCNITDESNLGDVIQRIQTQIEPLIPASCSVTYGGQFEAQQSASKRLLSIGSIVLVIILLLLHSAFNSWKAALVVLLNLPLALIGGIIAIFIADSQNVFGNIMGLFGAGHYTPPAISIASMVGFITLFGIAVRNGILLVKYYRQLEEAGEHDIQTIVMQGSQERLAPVLMTALSAILGMIPLALGAGQPGSELLAPLAVVVLGGLCTSTFLNLLVVPAAYTIFCDPKKG